MNLQWNHLLPKSQNINKSLDKPIYTWNKLGLLFNPQDHPGKSWMHSFAQAPSSLVFEDFVRIYFSCRPKPDQNGQYVSYSAYVDFDRNDLFKVVGLSDQPVLPLGNPGTFDEFGTYPFSVIPFEHGYLGYYGGWTRCESVPFNVAIGIAKSEDGKRFQRLGPGPVLNHSLEEPFILSGPKIRRFADRYYLFYIAGTKWVSPDEDKVETIDPRGPEPVYKIRMASSEDGVHWEKVGKTIIPDKLGEYEAQASPDVIYSGGRYHMFFCFRKAFDYRQNKHNSYRIGYAWSNDLKIWHREDGQSGLDVSLEGWDNEMVAYPHILELDGKTWMFYLGNQVGRQGFGLAQLKGNL